ncbi:histone lysine acetyltransferase CREBBP-like [Chionomys nivalis]|uniref:histone lysine acetyltransferase CREBBP-like n=1 Tax=Chionomys nivalis TaxID=269649 RepID=UPI002593F39B|nr:histone lysine acetyltransferase CREBBP-like [Chionomys nivalis]
MGKSPCPEALARFMNFMVAHGAQMGMVHYIGPSARWGSRELLRDYPWRLASRPLPGSRRERVAQAFEETSRRLFILSGCIQFLIHACQCSSTRCHLPPCRKIKWAVKHTKGCKRKTDRGCSICKQFIVLCCYHAKHCQENKCSLAFCLDIKQNLPTAAAPAPAGSDAPQEVDQ